MSRKLSGAWVVMVGLAAVAVAEERLTENTLAMEDGSPAVTASLEKLDWMEGVWEGSGLGGRVEESWTRGSAGSMMGTFKLIGSSGPSFYEFIVIEEVAGSLVLRLRHFNGDFSAWEGKDEHVQFPLVRIAEDAVWFRGLTYRRTGADEMRVFLALYDDQGVREEAFAFTRR